MKNTKCNAINVALHRIFLILILEFLEKLFLRKDFNKLPHHSSSLAFLDHNKSNMLALFYGLVTISMALTNAQTYDDCGSQTMSVGGINQTIQIERDWANSMVRIILTGPSDNWFGLVIGQGLMSGYAITGQGSSTYELVERTLTQYRALSVLDLSGTATANNSGSNGLLTLVRPYSFGSGNSEYFDFTDLMTCNTESISIAGAQGSSLSFARHTLRDQNKLSREPVLSNQ